MKLLTIISGVRKQTMNVHLLKHVTQFTRLYGPLFSHSAFGFESMNSYIKNLVHGTGHVNSQASIHICFLSLSCIKIFFSLVIKTYYHVNSKRFPKRLVTYKLSRYIYFKSITRIFCQFIAVECGGLVVEHQTPKRSCVRFSFGSPCCVVEHDTFTC